MIDTPREIEVEKAVENFIKDAGRDFRVCTTCGGPVIYPIEYSTPKDTDLIIEIGGNTLYVSKVQARYLRKIEMRMLERYLMYLERKSNNPHPGTH
ncbi:hypothetical protein HWN40_11230 [Methanolobus zinderi]|jgi:hypothetical protein|uniref:Uncharacterized protein n=1 Tax=Methanolobus zinderi TaxID=536044 RepID=A0A7D5I602_9EURY|nr:hypothetical protein [Methanolobus zinderi]KXS44679.1 MAG: hypothetical protein AWU59_385 [Methanolobus sp. T82-4]QLC50761.1 hypothetical protein HWN40_11230 [Methanolobus zinderi]